MNKTSFSLCFLWTIAFSKLYFCYATEAVKIHEAPDFEGWKWGDSLKLKYKDHNFDFAPIHHDLKNRVMSKELSKTGALRKESNAACISLSLISPSFQVKSLDIFKPYVFISGYYLNNKNPNEDFIIKGRSDEIALYAPSDYPRDLDVLQKRIEARYNPTAGQTILREKIIRKQSLREQFKMITSSSSIANDILQNVIEIERRKEHFIRASADSEQKIIFFFENSLKIIPYYWDLGISHYFTEISKIFDAFLKTYLFISPHKEFFIKFYILPKISSFQKMIHAETEGKIKHLKTILESLIETEKQTSADKLGLPPMNKKSYKDFLNEDFLPLIHGINEKMHKVLKLYDTNPINVSIDSESKIYIQDLLQKLQEFKEQLAPPLEELNSVDIYKTYKKLKKFFIPPDTTWLKELYEVLKEVSVEGAILHLHSKYDICGRCAPSLTRELERKDGFIGKLKSIILTSSNDSNPNLFFKLVTSCNADRKQIKTGKKSRLEKFKDVDPNDSSHINDLMDPNYAFFQTLLSNQEEEEAESSSQEQISAEESGPEISFNTNW